MLINRQEALDALKARAEKSENHATVVGEQVDALEMAIEALSAQLEPIKLHIDHALTEEEIKNIKRKMADSPIVFMPSFAEPQWIPCSERLPEKSGKYYVSGGDRVWICEFLIIPNFTSGWCNDLTNPMVQAWMPFEIPEPYRGGDEG